MQSHISFERRLCVPVQSQVHNMHNLARAHRLLPCLPPCARCWKPNSRLQISACALKAAEQWATVIVDDSVAHLLPQGKRWENVERWVMFSDLHVSVKTLKTCLDVLRKVKQEATKRKAGVLFLGKPRRLCTRSRKI